MNIGGCSRQRSSLVMLMLIMIIALYRSLELEMAINLHQSLELNMAINLHQSNCLHQSLEIEMAITNLAQCLIQQCSLDLVPSPRNPNPLVQWHVKDFSPPNCTLYLRLHPWTPSISSQCHGTTVGDHLPSTIRRSLWKTRIWPDDFSEIQNIIHL